MKNINWVKASKWIYGVAIVLLVIGILCWSVMGEVSLGTMVLNTAAAAIAVINTLILMILEMRQQYKEKGLVVLGSLTAEVVFFSIVYYLLELLGAGKDIKWITAVSWALIVVAASKTISYYKRNR